MANTKFKDLNLKNAFLFAAALQDSETCRIILEIILGKDIPALRVHTEHCLLYSSDFRSIRLDVYARDEVEISYNLEMQNGEKAELPKRSRFHQAEMDVASLKPGDSFRDMKPCYVIFICTFDPFDRGLYRYTFENRCREADFSLGDEACRIFLNTKGTNREEVPELLVDFLHYVEDSSDAFASRVSYPQISQLHSKVKELKKSREWEGRYMTFGELLDDTKEECRKECLHKVVLNMLRAGRYSMEEIAEINEISVAEVQKIEESACAEK